MTGCSVAYYPFPDDSSQTLHRVLSKLPVEHRRAMTWQPTLDWLLEVSPDLAVALSSAFADSGLRQLDPAWRPGAVLVPMGVRAAIEGWFNGIDSPVKWSQVEGVEFATARSRRAFEALI